MHAGGDVLSRLTVVQTHALPLTVTACKCNQMDPVWFFRTDKRCCPDSRRGGRGLSARDACRQETSIGLSDPINEELNKLFVIGQQLSVDRMGSFTVLMHLYSSEIRQIHSPMVHMN